MTMARTARKESEEVAEIKAPDFEKALRIIKNDVRPAEENNAEERGKLSGAWKAVEKDCRVNKAAAKLVNKLDQMSEENRDDFLRSLYGMMRAADIRISRDLVDQAHGTEETFPVEGETIAPRDYTASDAEWGEDGATSPGITGDNLPPELKAMVDAADKKPRGRKAAPLKLVTVPETMN